MSSAPSEPAGSPRSRCGPLDHAALIFRGHRCDDAGFCAGCRQWWAHLVPYPCWQVDWAARIVARAMTADALADPRDVPANPPRRHLVVI